MFCGRVGAKDTFVIGAKLLREGKDVPSTGSGLKKTRNTICQKSRTAELKILVSFLALRSNRFRHKYDI